ncbi:MAG: hypothetical protein JWP12_3184 [Bacteroidetes bacterium]|nr:hypothetical protein [Bacteroidota bacterium]
MLFPEMGIAFFHSIILDNEIEIALCFSNILLPICKNNRILILQTFSACAVIAGISARKY